MRRKWRLVCILDFFNMKTLLQLLLAQKLVFSKCVLFKNNLLQEDTAPLKNLYECPFPYLVYHVSTELVSFQ